MTPLDLELELSHHAGALRAMARDLLRDEHAAEDAVQQAVLCTLRTAPARPGSLGGWLATVLRHLCFQHRRHEQRRQVREQVASKAECLPAAAELAERRESLRRVTDAVLGLREPYQTALLLRYFEGLSPRQIARRTDTSVATVKSRLQRGLGLLRARMDRGRDDWRSGLAAAVGLPAGFAKATAATTFLATGVTLMGPAAKLGLVAAAAVAATALLWTWTSTGANEPAPAVATRDEAPEVAPAVASDQARAPMEVADVAPDTRPELRRELDHPFAFDLQVDVVDRDGLPVADAQVQVGPSAFGLSAWPERTDAQGTVHVRFRGKQPTMELSVGTEGMRALRRVVVESTAPARVLLLGGTPALARGRVRGLTMSYVAVEGRKVQLDGYAMTKATARQSLHPHALFTDESARVPVVRGRYEQKLVEQELVARKTAAVMKAKLALDVGPPEPGARIEGVVHGEDGRPVPGCTVVWGTAVDRPRGRTVTDDQGGFVLQGVSAGRVHLRAGGGDGGIGRGELEILAGQSHRYELRLDRQTTLLGRALDQDGKPLAGFVVEFVGTAQPWSDECTVRPDGTFELPNHPGGMGSLLLWSKDRTLRLPLLALHSVRPDNGPVLLRLDARNAAGQLQLETAVPGGVAVTPQARVWQEDTGLGCVMEQPAEGHHQATRLPAGWYRVEVDGGVLGWIDAGRHWVDSQNQKALGRVQLPSPGRLRIHRTLSADHPPNKLLLEQICLRRPDCDLSTLVDGRLDAELRLLAAGDYWFLWRDAAGVSRYQPFTIRSGGEALVVYRDDAPVVR